VRARRSIDRFGNPVRQARSLRFPLGFAIASVHCSSCAALQAFLVHPGVEEEHQCKDCGHPMKVVKPHGGRARVVKEDEGAEGRLT
jgi:ribosomal protein S27E